MWNTDQRCFATSRNCRSWLRHGAAGSSSWQFSMWKGGRSIRSVGNPSASSAGISGSPAFCPLACMLHLSGAVKTELGFTCRSVPAVGSRQQQPSWAGLSCCGYLPYGFLQLFGFQPQLLKEIVNWCCWETMTANFDGKQGCMPSFDNSLIDQVLVFGSLLFMRAA